LSAQSGLTLRNQEKRQTNGAFQVLYTEYLKYVHQIIMKIFREWTRYTKLNYCSIHFETIFARKDNWQKIVPTAATK
jgi:hypothetical protein